MKRSKTLYSITAWIWNRWNEYEPQTVFSDEDQEKAKAAFAAMHLHGDMPAIELYRCEISTEDEIAWHVDRRTFLDRRDY